MERAEMETFLTLCEELNFGRTAERMHVTTGLVTVALGGAAEAPAAAARGHR